LNRISFAGDDCGLARKSRISWMKKDPEESPVKHLRYRHWGIDVYGVNLGERIYRTRNNKYKSESEHDHLRQDPVHHFEK
jgi:hypothetical protein